jgi:hypothetical protein
MILITTYYESSNSERNNEIKLCLFKNVHNKFIEKIYLLNDKIYDLSFTKDIKRKIVQHVIKNSTSNYKLKYDDAVQFINDNLWGKICILSNSDIYFDHSLSKINYTNIEHKCFALLRYDQTPTGVKIIFTRNGMPRDDSQDCWIFKSPINLPIDKLDFSLGTLGCDSIFATILHDAGLKVVNPSFDIITTHVHNTQFRTYNLDNRIHGKYALLKPCFLNEEAPQVTFIDF